VDFAASGIENAKQAGVRKAGDFRPSVKLAFRVRAIELDELDRRGVLTELSCVDARVRATEPTLQWIGIGELSFPQGPEFSRGFFNIRIQVWLLYRSATRKTYSLSAACASKFSIINQSWLELLSAYRKPPFRQQLTSKTLAAELN
jgi:hypothetical protein